MNTQLLQEFFAQHSQVPLRLALNLAAMSIHMFGLYYRRYHNKEVTTSAALFNLFVFSVLTILSAVDFGVTAGFGLFAILALFTLRSEPLGKDRDDLLLRQRRHRRHLRGAGRVNRALRHRGVARCCSAFT